MDCGSESIDLIVGREMYIELRSKITNLKWLGQCFNDPRCQPLYVGTGEPKVGDSPIFFRKFEKAHESCLSNDFFPPIPSIQYTLNE